MKIKILDANTLGEDIDLSPIAELGEVMIYSSTASEDVQKRIADAEVIILNKVKLSGDILKSAKDLKLICVTATGYDNIDIKYCQNNNIAVCNVCGYSTDSVAQLTVSCVLSLVMHLPEYDKYVKKGLYTKSGMHNYLKPTFHEMKYMTWGVVGFGNIGKKVAEIAKAIGCRVIYSKKTQCEDTDCVSIDELCKNSDIITLHLPLSEETEKYINKERIEIMKPNVLLVNMARGAVIDEQAVVDAVKMKKIAGFATDVYSIEPMQPDSPFMDIINFDNTIFTPHMAWGAYEARVRCMEEVKENIVAFYEGKIRSRIV